MLLHVANTPEQDPEDLLRQVQSMSTNPSDVVVIIYVTGKEQSAKHTAAVASIVGEIQRRIDQTQFVRSTLSVADLSLDQDRHEVRCRGDLLHMSPAEFSLLEHLLLHRDCVQSDVELMDSVFSGMEAGGQRNTLWVHMHRLRKKLGRYGLGDLIQTIHGVGYILKSPLPLA